MKKPSLLMWTLAGLSWDALVMATLLGIAIFPFTTFWSEWPLLQAWGLALTMLVVVWIVHVALLPIVFRERSAQGEGILLVATGIAFSVLAGLLAPLYQPP